jgi:hypothetical protein
MPVQRRSGDTAARGVATATDTLRVQYVADGSTFVDSIVVSARANAAGPSAAQQAGYTRAVVRIGKANDGVTTLVANGGQDAYQGEGVVIADVFVPMIYQGGQPSVVPVSHRMESGDAIVVEVCGGIDNAGAAFDIDTAVCINRRPTRYGVTG